MWTSPPRCSCPDLSRRTTAAKWLEPRENRQTVLQSRHLQGSSTNSGNPSDLAALFMPSTTEPGLAGSTASCTARKSLPNAVCLSASVGFSELHVAGGCGIASPWNWSYVVFSESKPAEPKRRLPRRLPWRGSRA